MQTSVQVFPHVLGAAMKYVTFLRSPFATSQGQTVAELDQAFGKGLQDKAVHRLRDAGQDVASEGAVVPESAGGRGLA